MRNLLITAILLIWTVATICAAQNVSRVYVAATFSDEFCTGTYDPQVPFADVTAVAKAAANGVDIVDITVGTMLLENGTILRCSGLQSTGPDVYAPLMWHELSETAEWNKSILFSRIFSPEGNAKYAYSHTTGLTYMWSFLGSTGQHADTANPVPMPPGLPIGIPIAQIVASPTYFYALLDSGDVYQWGVNATYVQIPPTIVNMPAGPRPTITYMCFVKFGEFAWFLDTPNNTVYFKPSANSGPNQIDPAVELQPAGPRAPGEFASAILTQLACSDNTTLALDSNGTLWLWGLDTGYGFTGDGTNTAYDIPFASPVKIQFASPIVDIAGGVDSYIAIDANGVVYGWGTSSKNELGLTTVTPPVTPRVLMAAFNEPLINNNATLHVIPSLGTILLYQSAVPADTTPVQPPTVPPTSPISPPVSDPSNNVATITVLGVVAGILAVALLVALVR